jgi:ribosome recycling factor
MNDKITISLPSLIHRIGREEVKQAKEMALQHDCDLKRVRRSRNWGVSGEAIKIQQLSVTLKIENGDKFRYLIQKITTALLDHSDKLEPLDAKLVRLITDNPNITLAELIHITGCTMTEARTARFDADSW